jgi:hypothetical protein
VSGSTLIEMTGGHSPRNLLRQAVADQQPHFDRYTLLLWFDLNAPWADRTAVGEALAAATVNEPTRRNLANPEDLVFLRSDGRYEAYDANRHGAWSKLGEPGEPTPSSRARDAA